ncbi:acyl-CoA thioesterase [Thiolapillus sp.]
MKSFRHCFRVPFHEVDAAGILFHAHLFTHAHDAYSALMREMGMDLKTLLEEGRYLIPLVHAEADFRLPMEMEDEIETRVQAIPPGHSSFGFRYAFHRQEQLCATVVTRHVFLDRATGTPTALPAGLARQLQAWTD